MRDSARATKILIFSLVWLSAAGTLSAQSDVLSLSEDFAYPGEQDVYLEVSLANAQPIGGLVFDLVFDTGALKFTDADLLGRAVGLSEFAFRVIEPGRARIIIYDLSANTFAVSASEPIVCLYFDVLFNAPLGQSIVDLENIAAASVSSENVPLAKSNGLFSIRPDASLPAPRDLTAVREGTSVALKWSPPQEHALRSVAADDVFELEPNNDFLTMQFLSGISPIRVLGSAQAEDVGVEFALLSDGSEDDFEDLFEVELAEPGISITLSGFTGNLDLYILEEEEDGFIAASRGRTGVTQEGIDLPVLDAGAYVIAVSYVDPDGAGSGSSDYTLMLEGSFSSGASSALTSFDVYRSQAPNARDTGVRLARLNSDTFGYEDSSPAAGGAYYQVTANYEDGESAPSNEVAVGIATGIFPQDGTPLAFALHQNYPNPFNPGTTIRYSIPVAAHVRIEVFDLAGKNVATLLDRLIAAGEHEVYWDGRTPAGGSVATGVYFYRLRTGGFTITRKLVYLR